VESIQVLTEDQRVSKQVLLPGQGRRTPRIGDLAVFSVAEPGDGDLGAQHKLLLGESMLPFDGLEHVLLSMKAGEQCLARLPAREKTSAALEASAALDSHPKMAEAPRELPREEVRELEVVVTMHRWQRRDSVPMAPVGAGGDLADSPMLRKFELRPGPERLAHDIEYGSMVLVGLAPCRGLDSESATAAAVDSPFVLSWRVGEGAVPGYLETAAASMRLMESAVFSAPCEAVSNAGVGPPYDGQTPLCRLALPKLDVLLADLLDDRELYGSSDVVGSSSTLPPALQECSPLYNWMAQGEAVRWEELELAQCMEGTAGASFKLALLAATEAPDVCAADDEVQQRYLATERAHGNALAKLGRFTEASLAYGKALDAVRRTPLYKALFPTERGRIQGAYTRDPGERESPLEQLTPAAIDSWRASLVALHLNLALCAARGGDPAQARRHCSTVLGADPGNAKALFRRGSAAASQGDYDEALSDLQRAAELQPQDRAVREQLRELQRRMREHRETQRSMFRQALGPAAEAGPQEPQEPQEPGPRRQEAGPGS